MRSWASRVLVAGVAVLLVGRGEAARGADPSGDPVIAAVGDMACSPDDASFNGGAGTATNCGEQRVTDGILADASVDQFFGLGDVQYGCGDPADYGASYTPTYGRLSAITDPALGNHEYNTVTNSATGAACPEPNRGAEDYFSYFGVAAHPDSAGYYSFNLGSWHIIVLNANCKARGVGGCGINSPQSTWLAADLNADTQPCTLAYWHQPRWTGTASNDGSSRAWWHLLYTHHADLVLNGHVHAYERFDQLTPKGQSSPKGIRELIVGTGGDSLQATSQSPVPQPQITLSSFGFLRLVLQPTGYTGTFQEVASSGAVSVGDSFSGSCHRAQP